LRARAAAKLAQLQLPSGGFPWFAGGRENFYMTLYALEQFALLGEHGIAPPAIVVARAVRYVLAELPRHLKKDETNLAFLAYGAYVLTALPPAAQARPQVETWMQEVRKSQRLLTPYGRAWIARVEERLGHHARALELLESALDGARTDPLTGVYFAPERYSWLWYRDTIEKHAFLLRTLAALKPSDPRIAGLAQWLL